MKKIRKLLAYCVALATVMSVIVIPMSVSAAVSETNLFGAMPAKDGAFVSGISAGSEVAVESKDSAWQKSGTANVTEENGCLKVENSATGTGIRYNYAKAEPNKSYIISAYVKLKEGAAKASIIASAANSAYNSLPTPTSSAPTVDVSADKWTYVYGEYIYGAALTGKGTGNYSEQDRVLRGAHYEFKLDTACEYYIKNIQMIDITNGKNILHAANPGFERGILDTNSTPNQNGTFSIVSEDAHTGAYSAKGTAGGSINDIRYINYQLTKGQWYRASVYVKSNTPDAKVYVVAQQAGKTTSIKGTEVRLTGGWDKVELEFMGSDEFTKVHFGPVVTRGAEVYVDDFCLEAFTPADRNLAEAADVHDAASNKLTAKDGEYTATSTMIRPVNVEVEVGETYLYSAKIKINSETPQKVETTIGLAGSNKGCIGAGLQYSATQTVGNEYKEVYGIVKVVTKAPVDSNEDGVYESGWVDANGDGNPDMLDTNKDGTPETTPTTKFHFQFVTDSAISMSAKDFQIRKLSAFDIDDSYIGKVINEDGKTKLYINGPESTVYLFAASCGEGGNIESVLMDKVVLNTDNKCCGKLELIKNENYQYFIWDGNFKPLNTVYTVEN